MPIGIKGGIDMTLKVKPKCPDCDSSQVIARRDETSYCRICGWTGPTEDTKKTTLSKYLDAKKGD